MDTKPFDMEFRDALYRLVDIGGYQISEVKVCDYTVYIIRPRNSNIEIKGGSNDQKQTR